MKEFKLSKEQGDNYIISFRKAKKLYRKFLESENKKYNLSQNEIEIIMYIKRKPKKNTAKDIVEYLGVSKGMISRSIDILIGKEILEIEKDKVDKRIVRLKINKKSSKLIVDLEKSSNKFFENLIAGVSNEKVDIFTEVLADMIKNLEILENDM